MSEPCVSLSLSLSLSLTQVSLLCNGVHRRGDARHPRRSADRQRRVSCLGQPPARMCACSTYAWVRSVCHTCVYWSRASRRVVCLYASLWIWLNASRSFLRSCVVRLCLFILLFPCVAWGAPHLRLLLLLHSVRHMLVLHATASSSGVPLRLPLGSFCPPGPPIQRMDTRAGGHDRRISQAGTWVGVGMLNARTP